MTVHPAAEAILRTLPWLRLGKASMRDRGRYYHRHRVALLRRGMSRAEWNSTVVHEAIHAERGDGPCATEWHEAKQERAVDIEAARRLIPLDALIDALRWSNRDEEVAEQLDVDLDTLRCRSVNLTSDECVAIEAALYDEWRSA